MRAEAGGIRPDDGAPPGREGTPPAGRGGSGGARLAEDGGPEAIAAEAIAAAAALERAGDSGPRAGDPCTVLPPSGAMGIGANPTGEVWPAANGLLLFAPGEDGNAGPGAPMGGPPTGGDGAGP